MADTPTRIQLSRRKGWRMPPDTVSVARPGLFGNPFAVTEERSARDAVQAFRIWLTVDCCDAGIRTRKLRVLERIGELRGKHLACWCPIGSPCHGDVLLELANG